MEDEADVIQDPGLRRKGANAGPRDSLEELSSRLASKFEEGNFKGVVRLACADDTLTDYTPATLEALKRKHPATHPSSCFNPSPDPALFTININVQDVRKAIISFPNGSAGGPDGLRPQHLKDLTGPSVPCAQ